MSEYLKRENVLSLAAPIPGCFSNMISSWDVVHMPAEDVAPVKHGRWIERSDKGVISMTHPYVCNRCGRVEMEKEPYCNCGAKMDGEGSGNAAD